MSDNNKKGRWFGLLAGPAVTFFALSAIWKNETRFDFHQAASQTAAVQSIDDATEQQKISTTGTMDQGLTLPGDYVKTIKGYLKVRRKAEIYAWDRDKDSDGHVTWRRKWMSSLQSNSRNRGVTQMLSSKTFQPKQYTVGQSNIRSELIEFVDPSTNIAANTLQIVRQDLKPRGQHFLLSKGNGLQVGDERVGYSGIPVPPTATYFGIASKGVGVADTSQQRDGWINSLIQDTGVLHHIVAGDRNEALASMKAYIGRLKWIVRGVGVVVTVIGVLILFSTIFGALYSLPIIGRVAESGAFLVALVIGIPLALVTMLVSYLFANPFVLVAIIIGTSTLLYLMRKRGKSNQVAIKEKLEQQYGRPLEVTDMKELEFVELAQLAMADGKTTVDEVKHLEGWAKKHRWSDEKYESMLEQAKRANDVIGNVHSTDEHLLNLIQLAMADGTVTRYELKTIRSVAKDLGYDDATIRELTDRVRGSVVQPA